MNQETKFCLSCGKEIPFAASYCPYCGKPQVGLENQPSSPSPTLKQRTPVAASQRQLWYKNWMIWAIIVLGVGLVICIALLNSAKTTVVMQPAASSKTAKTKAKAKKKDPNKSLQTLLSICQKLGNGKIAKF
ncbi:zinc ribbon domain-containing protein [Lentilactobacillus buchneri]|uniref:zinc ribbon domain-containing protein n=1 Tax=Lentilactobacillus buchneri TaxID=1581 RepID=UPI0002075F7B|nr:zinc ribbon domain-containing protein [Lentilactobacillus buchneri]AEB73095.1 hypothetical protein Lbuc_0834 [Lentilactobacillus buchneri NRRL B-30929]